MHELKRRFKAHQPNEHQKVLCDEVRKQCHELATLIDTKCPDGREKNLALNKLEEVMMWACESLVRPRR